MESSPNLGQRERALARHAPSPATTRGTSVHPTNHFDGGHRWLSLSKSSTLPADCSRFPPAGRHSRLRACVMKYLGVRVVVEGKQEPGVTYIYAGDGLSPAEQLLLSSVRRLF